MVLAVVFIVPPLFKLFLPLIVAWLIAMLANPLVRFLENKIKIMRKHGTVIVIVVVLALICAAIYGIICFTVVQVSSLVGELPELYQSVVNNLQSAMSSLHDKFNIIPADIQSMFGKRNMQLNEYILTALKSLKSSPVSTVGNVASSLIDFFVLLILTLNKKRMADGKGHYCQGDWRIFESMFSDNDSYICHIVYYIPAYGTKVCSTYCVYHGVS